MGPLLETGASCGVHEVSRGVFHPIGREGGKIGGGRELAKGLADLNGNTSLQDRQREESIALSLEKVMRKGEDDFEEGGPSGSRGLNFRRIGMAV